METKDKLSRWNGSFYHENSHTQKQSALNIINRLEINPECNILDLGSGSGEITAVMAEHAYQGKTTGIDKSQSMVDFAKDNFCLNNINFICDDLEKVILPTNSFNLVTAFSCIHWLENQARLFAMIYNSLLFGGKFTGITYSRVEHLWEAIDEIVASKEWHPFFTNYKQPYNFPTIKKTTDFLTDSGFSNIKVVHKLRIEKFADKSALTRHVAAWLPHLEILSSVQKDKFMQQLIANYLDKLKYSEFSFPYYIPAITFTANKL